MAAMLRHPRSLWTETEGKENKEQKNNSGVVVRNQYLYRLFLFLAVVALPGGF